MEPYNNMKTVCVLIVLLSPERVLSLIVLLCTHVLIILPNYTTLNPLTWIFLTLYISINSPVHQSVNESKDLEPYICVCFDYSLKAITISDN